MPRSPDADRMWRLAALYSTVGLEMAVEVGISVFGGMWLDGRLGTEPWLFWLGLVIGVAAAVRTIMRVVKMTKLDKL